jgi:hypothetical protein
MAIIKDLKFRKGLETNKKKYLSSKISWGEFVRKNKSLRNDLKKREKK